MDFMGEGIGSRKERKEDTKDANPCLKHAGTWILNAIK